jgi:CRP/FNR family transcriptional regulator, cyclic AMP receptor protein
MSPLSRIEIFANLEPETLQRLDRGSTTLEPRNGTELFMQEDPADSLYAIIGGEGHVRIGSIDRRDKKLMVELFGIGDIFGEIGVIEGGTRTASAVTEGRVRLARISASCFMGVLNDTPVLGLNLAKTMSRRLRRTFGLFQDAVFERLEVRLARQLLYLSVLHARRTQDGLVLGDRLRQLDLADLLGATTRSIITILNAWRAAKIVDYDTDQARLTIRDEAQLRALVEHEEQGHMPG